MHQLTTFQLTQHDAWSLCNTGASCSYRIPHYRVTVSCEYYVHDEISMFTAVSSGSRRHGRPLTATAPLTQLVCVCTDLTRSANCSDRPLISCKNVLPAATYSRPVYKRCCLMTLQHGHNILYLPTTLVVRVCDRSAVCVSACVSVQQLSNKKTSDLDICHGDSP